MIRIVTCRDPLRSLDFCLGELAEYSKAWPDRRAFFLVPEEAKADSERRYLEQFDQSGLMMAEVLSFKRLVYRIFSEAGGLAVKRIGDDGKALLLCRLLQEQGRDFPFLERLAGKASYAAELSQILGDFGRYRVSADVLREAAAQSRVEMTREKLSDLALLKERFEALKREQGLVDGDEDFPRLCRLLREEKALPRLAFLRKTSVWIAGFALLRAFTPQELELMEALSGVVPELTIGLCLPGPQADAETREAYAVGLKALEQLTRTFPRAEIHPLKEEDPPEPRREVWRSTHSREEMAACAGEIKALLKSGRYRRRDIAVALCRDEDKDRLSDVFREYQLDPLITTPGTLDESPLLRYLTSFFRLASEDGRPQDLVRLYRTGLCRSAEEAPADKDTILPAEEDIPPAESPMTRSESENAHSESENAHSESEILSAESSEMPDRPAAEDLPIDGFENFLLASGCRFLSELDRPAVYKRRTLEGGFARRFYETELRPHLQQARSLEKAKTAADKARLIMDLMQQSLRGPLEALIAETRGEESERALLMSLSWEAVLSLLEECITLLGETELSSAEFGDILIGSLAGKSPGAIPVGIDRIRAGCPAQLLLYPSRVLFILGATAGSFPPGVPAEGLLQNDEREYIEETGGVRLPNYRRDSVLAGNSLQTLLCLRGPERIYLSCPSADTWDASALQLRWEREAENEEGAVTRRVFEQSSLPDVRWLSPVRARRSLLGGEAESQDGRSRRTPGPSELWRLSWSRVLAETLREEAASVPGPDVLDLLRPEIYLPEALSRELMEEVHGLSVSRLETFNDCPYKHFANYVLGLRERLSYKPDSLSRGSFMHAVMEDALHDLMHRTAGSTVDPIEIIRGWRNEVTADYVSELYNRLSREDGLRGYAHPAVRGGVGRRLRQLLIENLHYHADTMAGTLYLPRVLEWSFPDKARNVPPLMISGGGLERPLEGKIDRIDIREGSARIADYKSSERKPDMADFLAGTELQLPLYAQVWSTLHPEQKIDSMVLYFLLGDKTNTLSRPSDPGEERKRSRVVAEGELAELLPAYTMRVAQSLLTRMSRGEISPRPLCYKKDKTACDYCQYSELCRMDKRVTEKRCRLLDLPEKEGRREDLEPLRRLLETGGLPPERSPLVW